MSDSLSIESGYPLDGTFKISVSNEHMEELSAELTKGGLTLEPFIEHSAAADIAVYLVSAGALPSLAAAIRVVLHRHDGKSIKVSLPDGTNLEKIGYKVTDDEVISLLDRLAEAQGVRDEQWKKATGQEDDQ